MSARRACASASSGMSSTRERPRRIASADRSTRPPPQPSLKIRYTTASTASSRSGSRWPGGTANGMAASRILCLARVRRLLIVSNGTRKARAISSVERPPSVRRVSPTCASSASAGWQQVKISSSRSSGKVAVSSIASSDVSRSSRLSSSVFAASVRSRRMRSIARLRAVAISHPVGLAGTPSRGQRSAASANASCAASSASSMSPSQPTSEARTRPQFSRKTCSSTPELLLEDRTDLDRRGDVELLQR